MSIVFGFSRIELPGQRQEGGSSQPGDRANGGFPKAFTLSRKHSSKPGSRYSISGIWTGASAVEINSSGIPHNLYEGMADVAGLHYRRIMISEPELEDEENRVLLAADAAGR